MSAYQGDDVVTTGGTMGFTNRTCDQSGVWKGRCGHGEIVVTKGERFPECSGCRRGIDWQLVGSVGDALRKAPNQKYADSGEEGWWPGKETSATATTYS
jgi:hypothetical protein